MSSYVSDSSISNPRHFHSQARNLRVDQRLQEARCTWNQWTQDYPRLIFYSNKELCCVCAVSQCAKNSKLSSEKYVSIKTPRLVRGDTGLSQLGCDHINYRLSYNQYHTQKTLNNFLIGTRPKSTVPKVTMNQDFQPSQQVTTTKHKKEDLNSVHYRLSESLHKNKKYKVVW